MQGLNSIWILKEQIGSEIVIKSISLLESVPAGFCVAICTGVSKIPLVNVIMTISAIGELYPGKFLKFFSVPCGFLMAIFAIHSCMSASQYEISFFMIKQICWCPLILIVAFQAVFTQSCLMIVVVTIHTASAHP